MSELFKKVDRFCKLVYGSDVGLGINHEYASKNWESISGAELDILNNDFPELGFIFSYYTSLEERDITFCMSRGLTSDIVVFKFVDDWFYLVIFDDCYKCDQIYGLVECIKRLKWRWRLPGINENMGNDLYKSITMAQFQQAVNKNKVFKSEPVMKTVMKACVNILTDSEISQIKDLLPSSQDNFVEWTGCYYYFNKEWTGNEDYVFYTFKDNDEWFYVKYNDHGDGSGWGHDQKFFKCDELDGLLQCIRNEIIK